MARRLALLCAFLALSVPLANSLNNGLARTPPMGWLAWERFRCNTNCQATPDTCISEKLFMDMADRLAADGWLEAGYDRVNVDDCWPAKERDSQGRLVGDPTRFPHGMKALVDYVHSKGVKFGIYEDYGTRTCAGYPGSLDHLETDADTFAEWGVDMLKLDGCNVDVSKMDEGYPEMGQALNKTGRPIVYSCSWPDIQRIRGIKVNYTNIARHCNLWRNYNDVSDSWKSVSGIIDFYGDPDNYDDFGRVAGPGNWNDPDMLIVGDFSLNYEQSRSQFAIWSIMAAPLLMSNDLRNISDQAKEILLNKEVIAVNQDKLGIQGQRVKQLKTSELWVKPLYDETRAVVLFNRNSTTRLKMDFEFVDVGIHGKAAVRDLFAHEDLGVFDSTFAAYVNPDGVAMLKLTPQK